ncbi:MAG: hypothetical protein M1819_004463 [Sarea resinae]|nr:MAG: hypothetical protein M1819_004463 [Sarea resinae]
MPDVRSRRRSSSVDDRDSSKRTAGPPSWLGKLGIRSNTTNPAKDVRPHHDSGHHSRAKDPKPSKDSRSSRRRRCQWPPPPSVEDEPEALAKELVATAVSQSADERSGEGTTRGAVDQQPIILEVVSSAATPAKRGTTPKSVPARASINQKHSWTDDQRERRSLPISKEGRRENKVQNDSKKIRHYPDTSSDISSTTADEKDDGDYFEMAKGPSRRDSVRTVKEKNPDGARRGRKNPAKLETDFSQDDPSLLTPRESSPYAYTYPSKPHTSTKRRPSSGGYFMSSLTMSPAESVPKAEPKPDAYPGRREDRKVSNEKSKLGPGDSSDSSSTKRRSSRYSSTLVERPHISREGSTISLAEDRRRERVERSISDHERSVSDREGSDREARRRTDSPPQPRSARYSGSSEPEIMMHLKYKVPPASRPAPTRYSTADASTFRTARKPQSQTVKIPAPIPTAIPSPPRSPGVQSSKPVEMLGPPSPHFVRHSSYGGPTAASPQEGSIHSSSSWSPGLEASYSGPEHHRTPSSHSTRPPSPSPLQFGQVVKPRAPPRNEFRPPFAADRRLTPPYPDDDFQRPAVEQPYLPPERTLPAMEPETRGAGSSARPTYHKAASYAFDGDRHAAPSSQQALMPPSSTPQTPIEPLAASLANSLRLESSHSVKTQLDSIPPCPRSTLSSRHDDWYTLDGCSTLSICPTCLHDIVDSSPFRPFFKPSPSRAGRETKCDFSLSWMRLAWVLTLKQRLPHLDLIRAISRISATEQPCPGPTGAVRPWYHLLDSTGTPVPNFDVCPFCVRGTEVLFPPLRGIFARAQHLSNPFADRICAMRVSPARFQAYASLLDSTASKSQSMRRPPDMRELARFVRHRAAMRQCSRDDLVLGQGWHVIPQLPDLTVCEECYADVVVPAIESGSALAGLFSRNLEPVGLAHQGVSCQLYSRRMRRVFADAVRDEDLDFLAAEARRRKNAEMKLQAQYASLMSRAAVGRSEARASRESPSRRSLPASQSVVEDEADREREMMRIIEEWKRWE